MRRILICIMITISLTIGVFALEYKGIEYDYWKEILDYGNVQEKALSLEAIASIGGADCEEILLKFLESEERELRLTAVWALGQIRSAQAAQKICWMIGTENDSRIDGALVNIGEPAIKWLTVKLKLASLLNDFDEGTRVARIIVDTQSNEGLVEVASYLSILLSKPENREDARKMLSQIGDRAVIPLKIALETTYDKKMTFDILRTLLLIESEKSLDTFYLYISDSDPSIRALVANALGKIKSKENTEFLIAMLKDTDENVKTQAIVSLGELEDPKAVVYILTYLKEDNPLIRAMAAYTLGKIKDVRAVYPLINLLDDKTALRAQNPSTGQTEEQTVRDFAAKALIRINDPRGIQELEKRGIKIISE